MPETGLPNSLLPKVPVLVAAGGAHAPAGVPTVTVVIPCFNHGQFVAHAVDSALRQLGAAVQVVVVNDGSTDDTTARACDAAATDPRVHVIHQENAGLPAARNTGAKLASKYGSEFLVFLDADDWIEPSFVQELAKAIRADTAAEVSHAYCQERLVEMGRGIWQVPAWDPKLLLVTNLHPVTALVRRKHFEAVGGFDETLRSGYEDWDLWLRFSACGWRGVRVREPLFVWRRHSHNTMVMNAVQRHGELMTALIDRHRGLYAENARAIIELSNLLLRRADANWLDENGEAIYVRDLRARNCELFDQLQASEQRCAALQKQIEHLESKPSLRLARKAHAIVDSLPGPLAWPVRAVLRVLKRVF